jgi:hypothetical protein
MDVDEQGILRPARDSGRDVDDMTPEWVDVMREAPIDFGSDEVAAVSTPRIDQAEMSTVIPRPPRRVEDSFH